MDFQFIKLLTDTLVNVRFMWRGLFLELNGNMLPYIHAIPNIRMQKKKSPAASVVLSSIFSFCSTREKKTCPFSTT